ncbi:hypothetical protein [Croceivirga thetidis]|uniref:Uncharacterized protein n=1 Tax=Croceivirga thetidis TaxID=2721623 RepID=A0ABX1GL30_9FLAO|nr:hypothetical protein [Croceivirga thetidis]NKI30568.1 hypothetical protein [Croceivirga thetidis]
MKVKISILILSLLLSGCFSYQKVSNPTQDIALGERVKLVTSHRELKGKLIAIYQDTLVLKRQNGKTLRIAQNEVSAIKRPKFSILKTVAIPGGVLLGAYGVFQLSGGPNFNVDTGL